MENNTFLVKNGVLRKYQADSGAEGQSIINIPNTITSIGDGTFFGCNRLQKISIPDGVASIGKDAFGFCFCLESVIIPEGVTTIGNGAFSYCSNLEQITIPGSVTSIGKQAFTECRDLTIHAPAGSYAETYALKNKIRFIAE